MVDASIAMRLSDVCFAHWPVEAGEVTGHVPPDATLDTFEGRAWLSVVAASVRPRFASVRQAYGQVNVRTYLAGDRPAVHFLDSVVGNWLAAQGGRLLTGIPSRYGNVVVGRTATGCRVRCDTASGAVEMAVTPEGDPAPTEDGSLASWLVERYRYVTDGGAAGDVEHPPWRLQRASGEVPEKSLLADLPAPEDDPIFHYSPGVLLEG